MPKYWLVLLVSLLCAPLAISVCRGADGPAYSWQLPQATVLPNGDLEWAPQPFVFTSGAVVRYIDYANGNDDNPGTREKPFKHHPWDAKATAQAAACTGVDTYVFKRGVAYRGRLLARESGTAARPIRLTSDPSWGTGEASLYGAYQVTGGWQRCTAADAPASMPTPEKVWYLDPPKNTPYVYSVFETRGEQVTRIPIARTPNYAEPTNPDDVMGGCYEWTGPAKNNGYNDVSEDTVHLIQTDPDYYEGATCWSEWGDGWDNMGLPWASIIHHGAYDPVKHTLDRRCGSHGAAATGHRYYLEGLPAFLDAPGEFYQAQPHAYFWAREHPGEVEHVDHLGRLYLRLPDDRDPNQAVLELGVETVLIDIFDQQHIDISGLRFSFMDATPNNDYPPVYKNATAIRLFGNCQHIRVANCHFSYVPSAVQGMPRLCPDMEKLYFPRKPIFQDLKTSDQMENIVISDNDIAHADSAAILLQDGGATWGRKADDLPVGELGRVQILRNRVVDAAFRNGSSANGPAIGVTDASQVEIAGNVVDRVWGVGIWCLGGKNSGDERSRPLIRNLIHHNKVTNALLDDNDWGAIAPWQGGNVYVFDNIVGNPLGPKHHVWVAEQYHAKEWSCNGFAYYLDGTYKSYLFNNIAWGKFNELNQWLKDRSACMMVLGFQNNWFNNTIYKYCHGVTGSAGQRGAFAGNLFADISNSFFDQDAVGDVSLYGGKIHAEGASTVPAAATLAYSSNVFFGNPPKFGQAAQNASGATLNIFHDKLNLLQPRVGDVGILADQMPLRAPETGDFRLTPTSPARGLGVRYFVPWSLYMTVGEWSFNRFAADPTLVIGENFFMSDEYIDRTTYYEIPRNDLAVPGATAGDYTRGPLRDWIDSALRFNGLDRYCVLTDKEMKSDYLTTLGFVVSKDAKGNENRAIGKGAFTYPGKQRRTVDMDTNNFLIEAHYRADVGKTGTLLSKMDAGAGNAGYALEITRAGIALQLRGAQTGEHNGTAPALNTFVVPGGNDGNWHHLLLEVDRKAALVHGYLDGKLLTTGTITLADTASLVNTADFFVGKSNNAAAPNFFSGAIDFLRLCRGTLADAHTTMDELYTWEFDGPAQHDFTGRSIPTTVKRDAGAIQGM